MRFSIVTLLLSTFALASSAFAESAHSVPDLDSAIRQGHFEATPPKGHHFNAKAPAQVKEGPNVVPFSLAAAKLGAELPASATEQQLAVEVFVCDDANTFCSKKSQKFIIPAIQANWVKSPGAGATAATPGNRPAKPHFEKETGFYVNDPETAFALAKKRKLPLMIDFFGIWCPPCNHLEAMVFKSAEFKSKTGKRFVRLKLDADQEQFNQLKNRYKIQGLPTLVFTTPSGDEIFRLLGYRPLDEVLVKSDAAYANRNEGYAQLESQATGGNAEARYKAAKIALDREEPGKALEWLKPMKEMLAAAHDPRLADFYKAQLGVAQNDSTPDGKKLARETLEKWLKDFPDAPDAIENYQTLAESQQEAGDTAGKTASLSAAVALTERLQAAPAGLRGTEYTLADLAEARADLLEKLGDPARTRAAYLACADAYEKEALAEASSYARGPNLERGYCLSKAGETARSQALYLDGIKRFPGEYTFHQGLAKMWLEAKEPAKALLAAEKAVHFAYGNQRLKAMMTLARTYESLHQPQKAIQAIDAELASPAAEGSAPGTLKLRERLRAKADELRKG